MQLETPVGIDIGFNAGDSLGFRALSEAERATIVEDAIECYCNGAELKDIAAKYQVHEKTLYRLIVKLNPVGWWAAQYAKHQCIADEVWETPGAFETRSGRSKLNSAAWQLDRLEQRRKK